MRLQESGLCGRSGIWRMSGKIHAMVIKGPARWLGMFGRDCEYVIGWDKIVRIGPDIILVDVCLEKSDTRCKMKLYQWTYTAENTGGLPDEMSFLRKWQYRVIDSRPADDNFSIRRRRLCDECGKRFTTYEKVETIPLIIIKKDNNREQYDRAKLEAGVLRACHKRPVSVDQISHLIDEVETEIFKYGRKGDPKQCDRWAGHG